MRRIERIQDDIKICERAREWQKTERCEEIPREDLPLGRTNDNPLYSETDKESFYFRFENAYIKVS